MDECAKPNLMKCEKFFQNRDNNWRCYYKAFTHLSDIELYQAMIDQIEVVISNVILVTNKDLLKYTEVATDNDKKNPAINNVAIRN